jgi:hypothetical protein
MPRTTSAARFSSFNGLSSIACILLVCGCGAAGVTRGADLYAQGDYVGAAELFEHEEPKLLSASLSDRARYGLYRAATLLTLGDTARAEAWMGYTVNVVQTNPNALSANEHVLLERTLAARSTFAARAGHTATASASLALR